MISTTEPDSFIPTPSLLDEPPQLQEKTIARNTVDMYLEKYPTRTVKTSDICSNIPELISEKERSIYAEVAKEKVGKLVWDPNVVEYDLSKKLFQKLKKKYGTAVHEEKVLKVLYKYQGDCTLAKKYVKNNIEEVLFSGRGDAWSELEKDLFEVGMKHFGKNWRKMNGLIKSKTIEEIATYYYWWKLTIRSEVFYEKLYQENFREENKQFIANPSSIFMERLKRAGKRPPLDKLCVFLSDSSEYYSEDEIVGFDSEKNNEISHFSRREKQEKKYEDVENDDQEGDEDDEDDDEESAESEHEEKITPERNFYHNDFGNINDAPQFHNISSDFKTANNDNCPEKYNLLGDKLNGGHHSSFDNDHFEIFNESAHPLTFETFNLDFPINDAAPRSLKNQFPIIDDDDHIPPKKKFKMESPYEGLEH